MTNIAPTATIDPRAEIAQGVEIGPGCYIGPQVKLGPRCRLMANVTILGKTEMGSDNLVYPSVTLGATPQDLKYEGGAPRAAAVRSPAARRAGTVWSGSQPPPA